MKRFFVFLGLLLCSYKGIYPITTVYNLRIAAPASARQEVYEMLGKRLPSILLGTYVHQSRKTRGGSEQTLNAGLFDYTYSFTNWYARCDVAVGNVHEHIALTGTETTHTQTDDILFSSGYRQTVHERLNVAYSGLLGIPTHKDDGFAFFQFGTGHSALGAQIDGIYTLGNCHSHSFIAAFRFLHFFAANVQVPIPTKPSLCVKFDIGNVVDLFIAYHKTIKRKHHLEVGYNPSFAFGASTEPSLGDAIPTSGMRNSWYGAYRYIFIAKRHPMGFSVGVSYGFDSGDHRISIKNATACWAAYGINF